MCGQIALLIDHNLQRQSQVCHSLKLLGIEVHKAQSIQVAMKMAKKHCYSLVLMHFETVGKETFRFCSFIRSINDYTIIMILMRDIKISIEEKLFDCGVDDVVISKQISTRVLTKRIQARLHNSKPSFENNTITLKDTIVDFDRREVQCNGTTHPLPGLLTDLLKYFLNNRNRIISRKELLESPIWADSICTPPERGGKTFDVNIGKLRKIIESDPTHPQIIKSVRGIGWKLGVDV